MPREQDQWTTITEEELRGLTAAPEVAPAPQLTPQQAARVEARRVWNADGVTAYPTDPWAYFNRLLREDHSTSVDFAAAAAGLNVYEALVALQNRDPYFYELVVLRGPQGGYVAPDLRRRPHVANMSAVYGSALHEQGHVFESATQDNERGKPSIEECQARFLRELGHHSQFERVDGIVDHQAKAGATLDANKSIEKIQVGSRERMRGKQKKRRRSG